MFPHCVLHIKMRLNFHHRNKWKISQSLHHTCLCLLNSKHSQPWQYAFLSHHIVAFGEKSSRRHDFITKENKNEGKRYWSIYLGTPVPWLRMIGYVDLLHGYAIRRCLCRWLWGYLGWKQGERNCLLFHSCNKSKKKRRNFSKYLIKTIAICFPNT